MPPHIWLLIVLAWEIGLIAVIIQILSVYDALGIAKPSFSDLTIIVAFGLVVFTIIELTKAILRRRVVFGRR